MASLRLKKRFVAISLANEVKSCRFCYVYYNSKWENNLVNCNISKSWDTNSHKVLSTNLTLWFFAYYLAKNIS